MDTVYIIQQTIQRTEGPVDLVLPQGYPTQGDAEQAVSRLLVRQRICGSESYLVIPVRIEPYPREGDRLDNQISLVDAHACESDR